MISLKSFLGLAVKPLNNTNARLVATHPVTLPRLIPVVNGQARRCNSTTSTEAGEAYRVSVFEQAMLEIHGEDWKSHLNHKQRRFIQEKERQRQLYYAHIAEGRPGPENGWEDEQRYRNRVEQVKEKLKNKLDRIAEMEQNRKNRLERKELENKE